MNNLFKINQKILITIFLFLLIISGYLLLYKNNSRKINAEIDKSMVYSYDILKPKFTINNSKQNIAVTANEGNFIDSDEVLLKNNVSFKSKKFLLKSKEVYFNKKDQSAFSNKNSIFISDRTSINSEGFEITDKGDKIIFNGQIKLIFSK